MALTVNLELSNLVKCNFGLMSIESPYLTSYLMATVTFALLQFDDNRRRNLHGLDLWNGPRSYVNIPIQSPYWTSCLMAIVMFAPSVAGREIITYDHLKCIRFEFFTLKKSGHDDCLKIGRLPYFFDIDNVLKPLL